MFVAPSIPDAFRLVSATRRPIFRQDCERQPGDDYAMFYAPGCLCVVHLSDAGRFEATIGSQGGEWAAELWQRAGTAMAEADSWLEGTSDPECLTLYLNNECNLYCTYCYADPSAHPTARLELEVIAAAARLVAEGCRRKGCPFYIVFHGGGEPTLHHEQMTSVLTLLKSIVAEYEVQPFRYVATHGVMSEEKAVWLARHFDLIGLSCDGPADLQNSQRPLENGKETGPTVERTAHVLREEGCRFHVRTTITKAGLRRQAEIAAYLCQQLGPEEIHFEPVYAGGRTTLADGWSAEHAGEFVAHFLQARQVARQYGIRLQSSGSRPAELHGPYCHVFRHVLNLVPGGAATACFKATDAVRARGKGVSIGAMNRQRGSFEMDDRRVQELCRQLGAIPDGCANCFNRYHCARECPDGCPLDAERPGTGCAGRGFRCLVQKALSYAMLREAAEKLWATAVEQAATGRERVYGVLF